MQTQNQIISRENDKLLKLVRQNQTQDDLQHEHIVNQLKYWERVGKSVNQQIADIRNEYWVQLSKAVSVCDTLQGVNA